MNWWGYTDEHFICATFSDETDVIYEDWSTTANGNAGKNESNDNLILAETARMDNEWNLAIQYYYQVLNDSLVTADDFQALKGNTACHSKINQVPSYIDWLDDRLISYQLDDEYRKELQNAKALCNRLVGNYMNAIDHYTGILDSNPTVVDSCFALVDMGFTWLESGGNLRTKYAYLMPRTQLDQIISARRLLKSLRNPEASQEQLVPAIPVLHNNYPNPFNPSTTIEFSVPKTGRAKLSIFNIRGQIVRTLLNGEVDRGQHRVVWDGRDDRNRSAASRRMK